MKSDELYQTLNTLSKEALLEIVIDNVIHAQDNTGRKVAKKLRMSPQLFDYYIQKRKKEVSNNA